MNKGISKYHFPVLLAALFFKTAIASATGKYFDFSPETKLAYRLATSLRLTEAQAKINNLKTSEPDNLLPIFIENHADFLKVFLDENPDEYKRLLKNADSRIEKLKKGNKSSPYFLFTQAEIRLQVAILRGKFGDYLTAINETKQAYALLDENLKKFPDFVATKKSLGVLHALVGNVPDEYRWAIRFLGGMGGTIEQGLGELNEVIQHFKSNPEFVFGEESLVAYSFLMLHLGNQSETAWKTLKNAGLKHRENPLAAFALANVAMRTGRNDEAIKFLEECPTSAGFYNFYYRNFMLGLAKLQRLDRDANKHLELYVNFYKGQTGLKEACQKLAWHHLVSGNLDGYKTFMQQAKTKGNARFEPDKAALLEAKNGEVPDANLLKARLLFDGGYFQKAYELLKNLSAEQFSANKKQSLEFSYRMGRVCHRLGKTEEAVRFYERTISSGENEPWYFACNAALQLGTLNEENSRFQNARSAYKRCLDMEPDEYASGLHAKAKAGLNRLKGK